VDWGAFVCNFKLVKQVKDRSVGAALPAETMLVGMKDFKVLPYMLNSPGDHARPHFSDDFK
jgi:hypothetical protein